MATFPFNIAKGRAVELATRVKNGDPAASRLYAIPLSTSVAQATAQDVDDYAALVTAGAVEITTNGWARITLAAADVTTPVPDDVNDRFDIDTIDLAWGSPTAGTTSGIVMCYASVASPTNAQLLVISHHDWVVTGDGSVATATVTGFYRAA